MMKIALVLKTNQGGLWTVPQLKALRERGHEVLALIPRGPGKLRTALEREGIRIVDISAPFRVSPPWEAARVVAEVRRALRKEEPDVIFYHLIHSALVARFASLGLRMKRVHMVAGPLYLESRRIAAIEARLARLDDHIIAGSDYTRDRYVEIGLSASQVTAVPYGVDTQRFSPDAMGSLERPDRASAPFTVAMVAYVYAPKSAVFPGVGIKGHDVLLGAWARFSNSRDDVHLVLVGSGFDAAGEAHRQRLMAEYRVATDDSITWYDSVADVRPTYSSSHLSVAPSLSENHGSALESSSMGIPAIVSDAGALPEAVLAGVTGWVVPRGDDEALLDALIAAYNEHMRGLLAIKGQRARALMLEKFDLSTCSSRVAAIIEETAQSF